MKLHEAKHILKKAGYLIKETHAEDDNFDWLCNIVYRFFDHAGIDWSSNWRRDTYRSTPDGWKFFTVLNGKETIIFIDNDGNITGMSYDGQRVDETELSDVLDMIADEMITDED